MSAIIRVNRAPMILNQQIDKGEGIHDSWGCHEMTKVMVTMSASEISQIKARKSYDYIVQGSPRRSNVVFDFWAPLQ